MKIDVIDDLDGFDSVRPAWERVYASDPHTRYFLSHRFLRDWLGDLGTAWFVLAARPAPDEDYVAFLPMRIRTRSLPDGHFTSELLMAGNYVADYTGLLCQPQQARNTMTTFARALQAMTWTQINIDYVDATDRRYRSLASLFSRSRYRTRYEERVNKLDNVNNLVCPIVYLPDDWEQYLSTISANVRQKLRRLLRMLDADGSELQITFPTPQTLPHDYDALARLWLAKWSERKGQERALNIAQTNRRLTLQAYAAGELYMPILKVRGQIVAGLITFLDRTKKSASFYMTGRDETFEGPSPGLLVQAYSIRDLIGQGYRTYDFLRGDEPYKMLFGPQMLPLQCLRIARLPGKMPKTALDPRAVPLALDLATSAHRRGRLKQAATGYTQILSNAPDNVDALYRFGQLLEQMSRFADAERLFRRALTLRPGNRPLIQRIAACRLGASLRLN